MRLSRSGFKRVAYVSREEKEKHREDMVADSLPIAFMQDVVKVASEEEIAFSNINNKRQAENEQRKARKLQRSVVACPPTTSGKKAKGTRKKQPAC